LTGIADDLRSKGGVDLARLKPARSLGVGVQRKRVGFERAGLERAGFNRGRLGLRLEREGFSRAGLRFRLKREGFCPAFGYSFRYSRSRRVCVRLTGISVDFSSFIRRM
jgi:hypothetical protein